MDARDVPLNRLYHELADWLPLLSPPADYAEEAGFWRTLLREKLGPGRHAILDLGVGGGHNLSHLTDDFAATGVDLSEEMLAACRRLNPGVALHRGDMRTVRLGRTFAAVLVHDAIGYLRTEADLAAAFATAAAHLEPGGVLVLSPDHTEESFTEPQVETATNGDGRRELTYLHYAHRPDPTDPTVENLLIYVLREGGRLRIEHDRHLTGVFPRATWERLAAAAGFAFEERRYPMAAGVDYRLFVGTFSPRAR